MRPGRRARRYCLARPSTRRKMGRSRPGLASGETGSSTPTSRRASLSRSNSNHLPRPGAAFPGEPAHELLDDVDFDLVFPGFSRRVEVELDPAAFARPDHRSQVRSRSIEDEHDPAIVANVVRNGYGKPASGGDRPAAHVPDDDFAADPGPRAGGGGQREAAVREPVVLSLIHISEPTRL